MGFRLPFIRVIPPSLAIYGPSIYCTNLFILSIRSVQLVLEIDGSKG